MSHKKDDDARSGDEAKTFTVGYGKPPVHSRFQPGQSGNAKGRTRGMKCSKTIARAAFEKKISLREGEKPRTLTKKEALIESTINRGLQKGGKDADAAFKLLALVESESALNPFPTVTSREEDEILAAHQARLRRQIEGEAAARLRSVTDEPPLITPAEESNG